jgi:hypothetical protein
MVGQPAGITTSTGERLGFPPNEPLERTHELGEHILYHIELHSAHSGEAAIGVPSVMVGNGSQANPMRDIGEVSVYQELWTDHIPARSFLALAALLKEAEIKKILGGDATASLVGKP